MRLKLDWFVVPPCILLAMALLLSQGGAYGQEDRIAGQIGSGGRVVSNGNLPPKARHQYDTGRVDPDLKMSLVNLSFKTSPSQQAAMTALLAEQQDRSSPNYHHWITPEQYADQFGLSQGDIDKIVSWLQSNGLTVDYSARGRNWIAFSGTARNIELAFSTEIHQYRVDGETHFANSTDPSIPAELEGVVLAVRGLDDFRMKSPTIRKKDSSDARHSVSERPEYTLSNGTHVLVPDDLATIYDIAPLYANGINGTGQRIVIVGQSDINLSDIATFRSGILPVNVPQVLLIPGSPDPGITEDEIEADLDLESIGAVARNATIIYVNSINVLNSTQYVISENIAPVISYSFALCEQDETTATKVSVEAEAQQANLQGITWLSASGDTGAAGCDVTTSSQATHGAGVSFPASLPNVTAVGGTEFNEGAGNYWSTVNSPTLASALSYIPEIAWNDSALVGSLSASGGGVSSLYLKPVWQAGPGVPNDGFRDLPDVAMTASPNHDYYIIVSGGALGYYGGTSAATPVFAGIVTLLNQYYRENGQGNINSNLYRIPQTNAFHDIASGNNIVPCIFGTPNCTTGSFGYSAGPGYDLVTGLGCVDAYNLIANWNAPTPASSVVPSCNPNPVYEQAPNAQGYSWFYTITLTETAGVATNLTGFTTNGTNYSSDIVSYFGTSTIPAHGAVSVTLELKNLIIPTNVMFAFSGVDAGGRQWSQLLSVPFDGSAPTSLITIQTVPSGLQFSLDGGPLQKAPQTFSLVTGSTHSISVATTQPGAIGTQYVFTGWSDGGAASQSFTVSASGTLTAGFQTQYQLTISASPATGGTVTPASAAFHNSGAVVSVTATPNTGYTFSGWTGTVANASTTSTTVTMSSALGVTANFKGAVAPAIPTINSGGVVPLYSSTPVIQPGSWISIYGSNLANTTTVWNGNFPTSLGGVSVTINSKPGYLWFVSPGQITLQAPDDTAVGIVPVNVTTPNGVALSAVTLARSGPAFLLLNSRYATGVIPTPNGSGAYDGGAYDLLGPTGYFSFSARPVKVGEVLELYGVGFGPTNPPVPAGQAFSGAAPTLPQTVTITIGGVPATVQFSGIVSAGLYQLNVVVPSVASGDQLLQASAGGAQTPGGVYISVQ